MFQLAPDVASYLAPILTSMFSSTLAPCLASTLVLGFVKPLMVAHYLTCLNPKICREDGKHKRVRFLRVGKQKKSEKLELVHTNVWGLSQVQSLGGSRYYVIH